MNKYVRAASVRLDEAEALSRIEPLHRARRHFAFLSLERGAYLSRRLCKVRPSGIKCACKMCHRTGIDLRLSRS
jgi:hypothetical protein